jgi:hypothetical protein
MKNTDGLSTKADKQKVNIHEQMKSEVPVFETSPNKVEKRAIGQGKDKEQRKQLTEHRNINN